MCVHKGGTICTTPGRKEWERGRGTIFIAPNLKGKSGGSTYSQNIKNKTSHGKYCLLHVCGIEYWVGGQFYKKFSERQCNLHKTKQG